MGFFPDTMPGVEPDFVDRQFWDHCNQHELRFQACGACGVPRHPPVPVCPKCLSTDQKWTKAPPQAAVYSFTVIHHASHEAVKEMLPYVVATVAFESLPGLRLVSNIVTPDVRQVYIGMPVQLQWDATAQGQQIPRFIPIASQKEKA
ncbi:MAG: OB-fold domain-containing protein [Pusillimonas sp.]